MIESVPSQAAPKRGRSHRTAWIVAVCVALAVVVAGILLDRAWPFTRKKIIAALHDATGGKVEIRKFRKTFFPPGGIAEDVAILPGDGAAAGTGIKISRLSIRSSYARLFGKHVQIALDGAEMDLSRPGVNNGFNFHSGSKAVVDQVTVRDSAIQFLDGNKPLRIEVHRLALQNPGNGKAMTFDAKVRNPEPPGELHGLGRLGPWRSDDPRQTPIQGMYTLGHADLSSFGGISGMLSSQGSFQGTIGQLELQGTTDTPDFEVTHSGHKLHLAADYRAFVNGSTGDVSLQEIHATFAHTNLNSQGQVAGKGRKVADLNFVSNDGRIEDILLMFIRAPKSPVTGSVDFHATAQLRSQHEPFLKEVVFISDFSIADGHFTKPETQYKMDELSQQAQGEKKTEDPATALSNLLGHVELRNGLATFSNLRFKVPGASAHLHGTYDLISEKIDLHGLLLMEADLPHATSGIKSILLKPINVFLKKNRHGGARIPITIGGTYEHPNIKTDPM
ncbi:MAG TPA: AsmA-like C-terminal region-containing protein [Terriglobales bacterium]|nr:AsmA-like C-terminal region-containing protein [Terriglobales bacterium]